MPNAAYAVLAYPLLVLLGLFFAAIIWARWISGKFYICTDPLFPLFDIIPPFVHPGTDDVYLVPVSQIWLIWWSLLAATTVLPALVLWFFWRMKRDYDAYYSVHTH